MNSSKSSEVFNPIFERSSLTHLWKGPPIISKSLLTAPALLSLIDSAYCERSHALIKVSSPSSLSFLNCRILSFQILFNSSRFLFLKVNILLTSL